MSIETNRTNREILGFDGVRAIAVLIVMAGHSHISYNLLAESYPSIYVMFASTRGVEIFFVLSGFLITTLLLNEHERNGCVSLHNFYVRRAFRILPVYYLFLVMAIAISIAGHTDFNWSGIPLLLVNMYNYAPRSYRSSIDGHIWSLAVEWQYYLIWPAVVSVLITHRLKLLGILAVVIAISAGIYMFSPRRGYFNYPSWLIPAVTPIAMGSAAALLVGARRIHWTIPFIGCALYALPALHAIPFGFGPAVMAAGIALVIAWIFANQKSVLVKILEFSPLKYIGVISYGLYIWHVFLMGTGPERIEGQNWPPNQATGFVLLLLIAPLSYHGFELPVQALRKRFLRPNRKQEPQTLSGPQIQVVGNQ